MWAQIVKIRMKPGVESDLANISDEMRERITQRTGLVMSLWMRSQDDPQEYYTVIAFESEEQARAGEREIDNDPLFTRVRALGEGTPEYINLDVIESYP